MTNKESADRFCKEWLEGKSRFTINTSGSTGEPKTIELRREQMTASAKKTIAALGLQEGMTSLVCLNVNYIAGRMMLVRSLVAGMKMIVVEPTADPLQGLQDTKIDFVAMVPYQLDNLIRSAHRPELESIGRIILGGAPASHALLSDIETLNVPIYATFGMTETITHIALQRLNGIDKQDFFEVLIGVHISVDDRGCLVIEANYLNGPIVTNDVVELIDNRKFRWLGRWDNVINSGGIKIFPEKIEKVIETWTLTNRYFVSGLEHPQFGEQVVLVIEGMLSKEKEIELLEYLKGSLTRYEVPKQILYADQFITTPTEKVNRRSSIENALPRPGL